MASWCYLLLVFLIILVTNIKLALSLSSVTTTLEKKIYNIMSSGNPMDCLDNQVCERMAWYDGRKTSSFYNVVLCDTFVLQLTPSFH